MTTITLDPLLTSQVAKLTASDGASEDLFGVSVAISGDTVVVGAYYADVGGNRGQGAAYVFEPNYGGTDNWGQVKKLTASDGAAWDLFGVSVSISGDTIVVGANAGGDGRQGAAYVFERSHGGANNWGQVAKLTASDGAAWDYFGGPVAVSGDTVVVGAHQADIDGNSEQGAAYVFERNQGGANNWGQVKKLTASDGAAWNYFGLSVSLSGNTVVVGAFEANAAYVYERNQGGMDNWGQVKKLTASDGTAGDLFGVSVAISGDTVVVGADYADVGSNSEQGAAYVYERNHGGADNWGLVKKLVASDGTAEDWFGHAVSLNADTVVVGATQANAAYVFEHNCGGANNWSQVAKLTASDGAEGDWFGAAVAVGGDTVVAGALWADVGGNRGQGAGYVYKLTYPCLSVAKTVSPAVNAPYHGVLTYTVVLSNAGALSDTNVLFTDTLPAAVDFAGWVENPGANVNNDEISWSGVVAAGSAITFTFTVTHVGNYGEVVINTAEFSGTLQTGSDNVVFSVGLDFKIHLPLLLRNQQAVASSPSGVALSNIHWSRPCPFAVPK